jgi:dTMP kinase
MPLITFEGIDGCGKSTLLEGLARHLNSLGKSVQKTREPGGSELGQELRLILLRTQGEAPCPQAELLIYQADRAQHVQNKIRPWLDHGDWVLSDRFYDSSTAFQGAGRKIKVEDVLWLNMFASEGLVPDATILIDVPVEVGFKRREKRKSDRLEKEAVEFHQAVRDGYLQLAKKEKKRFLILNGELSVEVLVKQLLEYLKSRSLL